MLSDDFMDFVNLSAFFARKRPVTGYDMYVVTSTRVSLT